MDKPLDFSLDKTKIPNSSRFGIRVFAEINVREPKEKRYCDFCQQGNRKTFNPLDENVDICFECVRQLFESIP